MTVSFWQEFYDWHLALAVLCLVVIDISILGLYMLVEGVRGQLEATRVKNMENPEDITGVSKFLRSCQEREECVKGEKEFLGRCHGLAGLPGGEERVLGRLEWIREFLFPGGRFVAWERVLLQGCEKGNE